jgi:3-oxoacyl-[acyl-carrier protein] reductase
MADKKVAIVTGGTRGMGRSISVDLAKQGVIVQAVYLSNEQAALETKKEISALSSGSDVIKADLGNPETAKSAVESIVKKLDRIDILVNNAGIFDFSFIEDMTEEYFDNVFNVNFKSQLRMIRAVLPYMKKQKYGRIINATSIAGRFSDVGLLAYGSSKAAINILTMIASAELAPYGITVNAYAPGIIHTDMTDAMIRERGDIQVKQISMNRFGTGEDVAALVSFLASEKAGYITGEIIGVDGGFLKVQNTYRAFEYVRDKNT